MRFGVLESLVNTRYSPTAMVRAAYLTAATAGADSFWVGDHLNSLTPRSVATPKYSGAARLAPKPDARLEPWMVLGHLAGLNRIGRLRLGVGVTDAGRRNPAVTAQAAATLHLLTRGRAMLGLGVGEREGNEPYGVEWTTPVARLEEGLATIRALWDSHGELVSRDSSYFPLRNAVFDLPPHRGAWPPIWLAAHKPRMLRLTGRYADGWLPCVYFRSDQYARGLDAVRSAASDAGRDPMSIVAAAVRPVHTGHRPDDVDEILGSVLARAGAVIAPADMWARHGAQHPLGADFAGLQDYVPQLIDEPTVLKYAALVPESLLREIAFCGTPDEVLDQVASWRDAGLGYPVLYNNIAVQPSPRKALAARASFARILRGLRRL